MPTGLIEEEMFDWSTMLSTAFMTFIILTVSYAVLRAGSRIYNEENEAKTAIKKRFKGLFAR